MGKGGGRDDDYYSSMIEDNNSGLKWAKICLSYSLITLQLLLALVVGILVVSHSEIPQFVLQTDQGLAIYITCFLLWFVVQCPMLMYPNSLWNYPLFVIWCILFALTVGLSCSYSEGKGEVVLEGIILIIAGSIFITFTAFCGWIFGNRSFNLRPLSFTAIFLVFCLYVILQIVHPFAALLTSIYAFIAAMGFCVNLALVGEEMVDQAGAMSAVLKHYNGIINVMKKVKGR